MKKNPFQTHLSLERSHYCRYLDGELYIPAEANVDPALTRAIHEKLRNKIATKPYPCVAAQAAFNQETYRIGIYPALGSDAAAAGLARDLYTFLGDRNKWLDSNYASFLAVFLSPHDMEESLFENLLWRQLEKIHRLDREFHEWDPEVSRDPDESSFGFSFAKTAFFIVGFHANSSRLARQFEYPMMVFNLHKQFETLRNEEHFEEMKARIRDRDRALQGSINPMLADFGEKSEARQYSGRAVDDSWRCPVHFHAHETIERAGTAEKAARADADGSPATAEATAEATSL